MDKTIVLITLLLAFTSFAQTSMNANQSSETGEMFVHPFLAHMGLPDKPGEVSLRTHIMQTNSKRNLTTDFGLHIEAGLTNRVGLHIRNNAFREEEYTELMIQVTPIVDKAYRNGLAILGELELPTGNRESTHYKGAAGISGKFTIATIVNFNGAVEYDFDQQNIEYEGSFVFKASNILFPILEYNGDISDNAQSMYILPAIKFRINPVSAFGAGAQIAVTNDREFDIRALATYEYVIGM